MRMSVAVLSLLCALLVAALYHFVVGAPGDRNTEDALRAEIASLREELGRKAPSGSATLRRLLDLESRLARLEQGGGGDEAKAWTARDLAQLRQMLEDIRRIDRAERSAAQLRQRLVNGNVGLSDEQMTHLVPVLRRYTDSLLDAREKGRGLPPTERFRGAREAHARMCEEIRAYLPAEQADQVIGLFPPPAAPRQPGFVPPEKDG